MPGVSNNVNLSISFVPCVVSVFEIVSIVRVYNTGSCLC